MGAWVIALPMKIGGGSGVRSARSRSFPRPASDADSKRPGPGQVHVVLGDGAPPQLKP